MPSFAIKWVDWETIILCDMNQTLKDRRRMFFYILKLETSECRIIIARDWEGWWGRCDWLVSIKAQSNKISFSVQESMGDYSSL